MQKVFKTLYDLMRKDAARGQRIPVLWRFFWAHVKFLRNPFFFFDWAEGTKLKAIKGWPGSTECYYYGLYDRMEFSFLDKYIHKGDVFVDVGANIGSYSIFAAKKGCQCIAIEAHPHTFMELVKNIKRNHLQNTIRALNCAAGNTEQPVKFTSGLDMCNHIVNDNEKPTDDLLEVDCRRVDNVIEYANIVKIDVEGFELHVLKGMQRVLEDDSLKYIIIESLNHADQIEHFLSGHRFVKCTYDYNNNRLKRVRRNAKLTGGADNYIFARKNNNNNESDILSENKEEI